MAPRNRVPEVTAYATFGMGEATVRTLHPVSRAGWWVLEDGCRVGYFTHRRDGDRPRRASDPFTCTVARDVLDHSGSVEG